MWLPFLCEGSRVKDQPLNNAFRWRRFHQRGLAAATPCSQPPSSKTPPNGYILIVFMSRLRLEKNIMLWYLFEDQWKNGVENDMWNVTDEAMMETDIHRDVQMSGGLCWLTRQGREQAVTKLGFIDLFSLQSQRLFLQISNHRSYFILPTSFSASEVSWACSFRHGLAW